MQSHTITVQGYRSNKVLLWHIILSQCKLLHSSVVVFNRLQSVTVGTFTVGFWPLPGPSS